jgi:hypothetical protein
LLLSFSTGFATSPFSYDLQLTRTPGKNSEVMIVAHGKGGSYKRAETVQVEKTLISFNFPDYNYGKRQIEPDDLTFGTADEILPLIYVIHKMVTDDRLDEVDLYGFSAGGGAIINAIASLNTDRFNDNLQKIGVDQQAKNKMLQAIQKGQIVLDCPLKSIREIIAFKGPDKVLEVVQKRYQDNNMEPIDVIEYLKGLSLKIVLYFNNPDEILSNRDDELYYERLKKVNSTGKTLLIMGKEKGHNSAHPLLWDSLK